MLCFDTTLLSDYLDGEDAAKAFLTDHEPEPWAAPSLAVFESYMGAIYGRPRGDIDAVYEATRELEVLPIEDSTALRAARLQSELKSAGIELGLVDAVLLATADEHGATLATADQTLLKPAVRDTADVTAYPRT